MKARDERSWEKNPETFEATKLGSKMHKAFMAEVGEEMCQAELAHHANQSPEYLLSRPLKDVYLYKSAQAIHSTTKQPPAWDAEEWPQDGHWHAGDNAGDGDQHDAEGAWKSTATKNFKSKPSDVSVYEGRWKYDFYKDTPCSKRLLHQRGTCGDLHDCKCLTMRDDEDHDVDSDRCVASTPYEQVQKMSVFQFFWLVRFVGGSYPRFQWQNDNELPIVNVACN